MEFVEYLEPKVGIILNQTELSFLIECLVYSSERFANDDEGCLQRAILRVELKKFFSNILKEMVII